jgi:hypothetical protein
MKLDLKGGRLDMKMGLRMGLKMARNTWRMRSCRVLVKEEMKGTSKRGRIMQRLRRRSIRKASQKV